MGRLRLNSVAMVVIDEVDACLLNTETKNVSNIYTSFTLCLPLLPSYMLCLIIHIYISHVYRSYISYSHVVSPTPIKPQTISSTRKNPQNTLKT